MEMMAQYLRIRCRPFLRRLAKEVSGLETIEIVLIAALVVIASIAAWRMLGGVIQDRLYKICVAIMGDAEASKCGTAPEIKGLVK
ncbi:MAG: Flp family type IVb pilin [Mycobacterium leprae]